MDKIGNVSKAMKSVIKKAQGNNGIVFRSDNQISDLELLSNN